MPYGRLRPVARFRPSSCGRRLRPRSARQLLFRPKPKSNSRFDPEDGGPRQTSLRRQKPAWRSQSGSTNDGDAHPARGERPGSARAGAAEHRAVEVAQSRRVCGVASQRRAGAKGRDPHGGPGLDRGRGQGVLADLSRVRSRDGQARRRAGGPDRGIRAQLLPDDRCDGRDSSPARRSTSRHGDTRSRRSATTASRKRCRRERPCGFCRSSTSCC